MNIGTELQRAKDVSNWVYEHLDGRQLPVPRVKRQHMASAAQHVVIEHAQAIILLIDHTMFASALALLRPLFESYLRGAWLLKAATDKQVDRAGRDQFPDAGAMVKGLDKVGMSMVGVKNQLWKTLCSYTHTGFQQIGARLTPEGLGANYHDGEIELALKASSMFSLLAVIEFAKLADDEALAMAAFEEMKRDGQAPNAA